LSSTRAAQPREVEGGRPPPLRDPGGRTNRGHPRVRCNDGSGSVAIIRRTGARFRFCPGHHQLRASLGVRSGHPSVSDQGRPWHRAGPDGNSPALGIDGFGRYIVTYTHFNGSTGHFDIFSRRDVLGW